MKVKIIPVVILLISIILFFVSYFLYHHVSVGVDNCASCGGGWLSPIESFTPKMFQSTKNCIDMCIESPIPHPLNEPFLISGTVLLILAILLFLLQLIRNVRHS